MTLSGDRLRVYIDADVYMPVVAGMGGNASTQSMAVTVRGLALGQVSLSTGGRVIWNEVVAGAANGAITGLLVTAIAAGVNQSPLLGLVLGISMILNLRCSGTVRCRTGNRPLKLPAAAETRLFCECPPG